MEGSSDKLVEYSMPLSKLKTFGVKWLWEEPNLLNLNRVEPKVGSAGAATNVDPWIKFCNIGSLLFSYASGEKKVGKSVFVFLLTSLSFSRTIYT
jgi:hypothetical protein